MPMKLPGWVIDEVTSVREEVQDWRNMTPAERWRLAHACARDAMWAARASGIKQRILDHVDPLPPSSVHALDRLRHETGWGA